MRKGSDGILLLFIIIITVIIIIIYTGILLKLLFYYFHMMIQYRYIDHILDTHPYNISFVQTNFIDEKTSVDDDFTNNVILNEEMKQLAEIFSIEYYPEDGDTVESLVSKIKTKNMEMIKKHKMVLAEQQKEVKITAAVSMDSKSNVLDVPGSISDVNKANNANKSKWKAAVKKITSAREKGLMSEQNRLLDKLDSLKQKYANMEAKYNTMRQQLSKSERSNAVMATILHQRSQSNGTNMMMNVAEESEKYEELLQYFQFMSQEWGHPDYEELQTISGDAEEDLF